MTKLLPNKIEGKECAKHNMGISYRGSAQETVKILKVHALENRATKHTKQSEN